MTVEIRGQGRSATPVRLEGVRSTTTTGIAERRFSSGPAMKMLTPVRNRERSQVTPRRMFQETQNTQSRMFRPESPVQSRDIRTTANTTLIWSAPRTGERTHPQIEKLSKNTYAEKVQKKSYQEHTVLDLRAAKQVQKIQPFARRETLAGPTGAFKSLQATEKMFAIKHVANKQLSIKSPFEKQPNISLPIASEKIRPFISPTLQKDVVKPTIRKEAIRLTPDMRQAEKVRNLMLQVGFQREYAQQVITRVLQEKKQIVIGPEKQRKISDQQATMPQLEQGTQQVSMVDQTKQVVTQVEQASLPVKVKATLQERYTQRLEQYKKKFVALARYKLDRKQQPLWMEVDTRANIERVKTATTVAQKLHRDGKSLSGEAIAARLPIDSHPQALKSDILKRFSGRDDGSFKEVVQKISYLKQMKSAREVGQKVSEIVRAVPAVRVVRQPTSAPVTIEDVQRVLNDKQALLTMAKSSLK